MFVVSLYVIVLLRVASGSEPWVDPYEMGISNSYPVGLYDAKHTDDVPTTAYFKRTINVLLNVMEPGKDDTFGAHVTLELSRLDYQTLWDFANDARQEKLHRIDEILTNMIRVPKEKKFASTFNRIVSCVLKCLLDKTTILLVCGLCYLYVLFKLLMDHSVFYVSVFAAVNLVGVEFLYSYMKIYKKEIAEQVANLKKIANVPDYCDPNTVGYIQKLWNYNMMEDDCQKYYSIKFHDVFWQVSPARVLLEAAANCLLYPSGILAEAYSTFIRTIHKSLPIGLNLVTDVFVMVVMPLLIIVIIITVFRVPFKFNLLHFVSFSINERPSSARDVRQFIEDVKEVGASIAAGGTAERPLRVLGTEGGGKVEVLEAEGDGSAKLSADDKAFTGETRDKGSADGAPESDAKANVFDTDKSEGEKIASGGNVDVRKRFTGETQEKNS